MAKFHELKVIDVRRETPDTISVAFEVPAELKDSFRHIQGQYVTLKVKVNGEELRRSYSICSSPLLDERLRIAVKKVENGRVSTYLNENLKIGDYLEVMTPMGNFYTQLDEKNRKQYVAFAAGSGITPVISILKTVLHMEPQSKFILFYGNKDRLSIIFKEELDRLMEKYHDRLNIYHILSRVQGDELFTGRITAEKVEVLIKRFVDQQIPTEYFICGPERMMQTISEILESSGVDNKNIHVELFTSPVQSENDLKKTKSEAQPASNEKSTVKVIMDGEETVIELSRSGPAILDAALDADVDVPYACKGAVCCTCKARIVEGEVEMEMNYALTDEEIAEGYALTCQSHPITKNVVVDYDDVY